MNSFPFFMVNAFGNGPQSGNPAGVCLLDEWKSTQELQSLASQISLPETAFVIPSKKDSWVIRWFSITNEVNLCGHATLAAAHCMLVPFWAKRFAKHELRAIQLSQRGGVFCGEYLGEEVILRGSVDQFMSGEIRF